MSFQLYLMIINKFRWTSTRPGNYKLHEIILVHHRQCNLSRHIRHKYYVTLQAIATFAYLFFCTGYVCDTSQLVDLVSTQGKTSASKQQPLFKALCYTLHICIDSFRMELKLHLRIRTGSTPLVRVRVLQPEHMSYSQSVNTRQLDVGMVPLYTINIMNS